MFTELQIINPTKYPGWDELVLSTKGCTFFHSSHWARVLQESYGYRSHYFALIGNRVLLALIPCMEIRSLLTGKRAVSLPFTDYCEPIREQGLSNEILYRLLNNIIAYGKQAAWKSIELRCGTSLSQQFPSSYRYYGHTLDISKRDDETFSAFRDSTKRNINKAIKEGVRVGTFHSLDSVREFYRLNCLTRKEHGLPPQPWRFFEKVYQHVLSQGKGCVLLASYGDRCIAGGIYFHFGKKATYKYGASDRNYQHLRANNLVMWEAIKSYSRNGYKSFCFGRTERHNDGLLQFKRGWSARERIIIYHKYDLKSEAFLSEGSGLSRGHTKILHNMPMSLLRITGSILYKHIG